MAFLTAEASVAVAGKVIARRELLRIERGDRRFELRPPGTPSSVCLDLAPGLIHATLTGGDRATLEVEWMIHGGRAVALDGWAMCARNASEVSILDALGRPIIPDLTARDPSMAPMVVAAGLYLLRAETSNGPLAIRIGQAVSHGLMLATG